MKGHFPIRSRALLPLVSLGIAALGFVSHVAAAANGEGAFLELNRTAMNTMMDGMAVRPAADVDRDFVAMMVPHHQGAIDMAKAELLYGRNDKLRRIAQEIVVGQSQEIAAMGLALAQPGSAEPGGDAAFMDRSNAAMAKMMADMAVKPSGDVDHDFVAMMVPHHQGAIDMARAELRYGRNPRLETIAQEIVVDQLQEITLMRLALGEPLPLPMPAPTQEE